MLIYLAGSMEAISEDEARAWRKEFSNELLSHYKNEDSCYGINCHSIFDPTKYYTYKNRQVLATEEAKIRYDKECFDYEMRNVNSADYMIVNLSHIRQSVGTLQELAIAYQNDIPIIGINKNNEPLHSWVLNECSKICFGPDAIKSAANYLYEYYLEADI